MDLQKSETIAKILAAIVIPIVIAIMGNKISESNKRQETQTKLVEVAIGILEKEPRKNQSTEQRELRRWAVSVVNTYSGVPIPKDVEQALVDNMILPVDKGTENYSGPWGIVFGADKTLDEAQWEIKNAAKKTDSREGQIFLRSGLYRSVSVHETRDNAEDARGKLKQYRDTAYIVDMSKWCPNTVQQKNYLECKI